jgi:hypothetical protein
MSLAQAIRSDIAAQHDAANRDMERTELLLITSVVALLCLAIIALFLGRLPF